MKDVIKCPYCGAENVGLEPDEDGDLVCEECGEILDVSFCYIVDFVLLCYEEDRDELCFKRMRSMNPSQWIRKFSLPFFC